jgi:hypothetical protein
MARGYAGCGRRKAASRGGAALELSLLPRCRHISTASLVSGGGSVPQAPVFVIVGI